MKLFALLICSFLISATSSAEEARLTWLGHAAFLYKSKTGLNILIDPFLKNPKYPKDFKLPKIDAILVTHGHGDHVGDAFELAQSNNCPLVASYELTVIAGKKGVKNLSPLNPQGSATFGDVTVTAVAAVHSSSYDDNGTMVYAGAAMGFILQEPGTPTLYHAGDTGVFGDMAMIKSLYLPEIALLPIGGVYTMKPREAAVATRILAVKTVVPMHFGTFPMLTGTPAELKKNLKTMASATVKEMVPGKEVTLKSLLE